MPAAGDGRRRTIHGACRPREIAKTGDRGKAREGYRNDATVFEQDDLVGGLERFGPARGWPTCLPGQKKRMATTISSVLLKIVRLQGFSFFRFFQVWMFDFVRFWSIVGDPGRSCASVDERGGSGADLCGRLVRGHRVAFRQSQRFDAIDYIRTDVLVG